MPEQTQDPSEAPRWERLEWYFYVIFAAAVVLWAACTFYGSMRQQIAFSDSWQEAVRGQAADARRWSAPLDDVFIHFDFARSAAEGRPFEWIEGNGYSSGGTSPLYPLVLAIGYRAGFTDLSLMFWAAIVACISVFGALLAARRLFSSLPKYTAWLAPPALLSVGALDWSLFSGMEVAFFVGLWALLFAAWDTAMATAEQNRAPAWGAETCLGAIGAALVLVRPEAVTTIAASSLTLLFWQRRSLTLKRAALSLSLTAMPGVVVVVLQAIINQLLTGESTAAGAVVKLELHNPNLTLSDVWNAWWFHLGYQFHRITHHHFSEVPAIGWVVWLLAFVPLLVEKARPYAVLLWLSVLGWAMVVALNGQVRWQNERYAMPAVAWLLLAAALGLGVLLDLGARGLRERRPAWVASGLLGVIASAAFLVFQAPRFRDQVWFFGRASRNILDQHVETGLLLKDEIKPRRVLVGDAGAIPYVARTRALDIIGLGGYRGLPFARATRAGVAGAIELIERLPAADRPDTLALYPGWWGELPLWFGQELTEVPVRGNVIAGGISKVLYEADWSPLLTSSLARTLRAGERVVDSIDFADIVSERERKFASMGRGRSFLAMKMLRYPGEPHTLVWDAGRIVGSREKVTFTLHPLRTGEPARLLLRTASTRPEPFEVRVNGVRVLEARTTAADFWQEAAVELSAQHTQGSLSVELLCSDYPITWYHGWLAQEASQMPGPASPLTP